jgi:hypothetical protein
MYRFKTAVLGTGFVGRVHLDALRRLGYVETAAMAAEFDVPRAEQDYRSILGDPAIRRGACEYAELSALPDGPGTHCWRASKCCARSRWLCR